MPHKTPRMDLSQPFAARLQDGASGSFAAVVKNRTAKSHAASMAPADENILQKCLQKLMGTSGTVLPLGLNRAASTGLAIQALFQSGGKILVVDGGDDGKRLSALAASCGLNVESLSPEPGEPASPEAVKTWLDSNADAAGVLTALCETSAGVLHPVSQIGTAAKQTQALLFVDATTAIGTLPCHMDEWGIDCLLASLHESLPTPSGMTALALSERAWKTSLHSAAGHAAATLRQALHAPLHAPETAPEQDQLAQLCASLHTLPPQASLFRHCQALARMVQTGFTAMGLDLVARLQPAPCTTALRLPFGIDPQRLLETAAQQCGMIFSGTVDDAGRAILQMSHTARTGWGDACAALAAFARAYEACGGHIGTRDYLEQALAAYWQSLNDAYSVLAE